MEISWVEPEPSRIDRCKLYAHGQILAIETILQRIVEKLMARAEMLNEYFSMSINDKGELESLPLLLPDYTPNLDKLPLLLMRLGPQVCNLNAFRSVTVTGINMLYFKGELGRRARMLFHIYARTCVLL